MSDEECLGIRPVGVIRTSFMRQEGTPIQPVFAEGAKGTVEVCPEYKEGLLDLVGFERIWLLYLLHCAPPVRLQVIPYRDNVERGIFATRSPSRPNPIGLSCVRLLGVSENILTVADLDILDGAPLLDIKPYVPQFDSFPHAKAGWLDERRVDRTHADGRFETRRTK
jgi:tRNA-Thr(GGU) m(6)t(6)A37 methyltransferase TsaA